eukprot:6455300-Amphidinium_carterae.1
MTVSRNSAVNTVMHLNQTLYIIKDLPKLIANLMFWLALSVAMEAAWNVAEGDGSSNTLRYNMSMIRVARPQSVAMLWKVECDIKANQKSVIFLCRQLVLFMYLQETMRKREI